MTCAFSFRLEEAAILCVYVCVLKISKNFNKWVIFYSFNHSIPITLIMLIDSVIIELDSAI